MTSTKAAYLAQGAAQPLCGAAWTPDSQALLVANKGSKQLVALYFTQKPPGMEAQTFPVSLPPSGTLPRHTEEQMSHVTQINLLPDACLLQRILLHASLLQCVRPHVASRTPTCGFSRVLHPGILHHHGPFPWCPVLKCLSAVLGAVVQVRMQGRWRALPGMRGESAWQ